MVDGLHLHEFGPGHGPVAVALHGVTGHGGRFRALAERQLPGHRVIAPDLRGHGRSPSLPPWTLEQHAADVLAVLERHGPALVIGHSFGGVVALHAARLAPERVRALLLIDPAVHVRPEDALANAESAGNAVPDREGALDAQRGDWSFAGDDVIREEVDAHWTRTERGWHPRYCAPAVATAWSEMCRPAPLPAVRTVIVRALRAGYVDAGYLRACEGAGAPVEVVDVDCGHVVHLEQPDRVGELLAGLA